jgi:hypothetical protein
MLLAACGLVLAAAGGWFCWQTLTVDELVAAGDALGRAGAGADAAQLQAALAGLDGQAGAEAAAARMRLRYALAWKMPDRLEWRRQLLAALTDGREGLAASPTRADIALLIADIEFVLFGPGSWVYQPLELSFRSAPREEWLIYKRIDLDLRLVAAAPPEAKAGIVGDIAVLGEPFRSTDHYRVLARAAYRAGPAAIAAVRQQLARGHPWPLQFFNEDLNRLATRAPGVAAKGPLR